MRTHMKHRDARPRGRERQTAAQRKIEQLCFAPGLQNDRAQAGASEAFACGSQRVFEMRGSEQKNARRHGAELEKTRSRNLAGFEAGKILPNPKQRFFICCLQSERQRKPCRRRLMAGFSGIDLVQRPASEPAMKRRIGQFMA